MSSNDSNSCETLTTDSIFNGIIGVPETPPSSDRSTPPNFDDLTHNLLIQNSNTLPNIAFIPAINLCPISPMSPILPNQTSILTIKTQNDLNLLNNNIKSNSLVKTKNTSVDKRLDLSQLRREARKLRNREAANVSRKRKKEYIEGLESKINCLIKENFELKSDNQKLKQRLLDLEEKHKVFTKRGVNYSSIETNCKCRPIVANSSSANKKATISLLAVILMLGLNLGPFSSILISNDNRIANIDSNPKVNSAKHGTGRSLLWNSNENNVNIGADVIAFNTSFINSSRSDINCKTYFNQTESLRLETDLRVWLSRVKMEKEEVFKHKKRLQAKNNKMKDRFNKPIPLNRLKAWIQKRTETDFNEFNEYSIDSFKNFIKVPQINYEELLSAIHRRDDTFYLLSYSSKDHLIIPPVSQNSSEVRPRFSLLIPLISTLNESSIRGTNFTYNQMSIMQIDCQVINTKMVLFNISPNTKTYFESNFPENRNKTFQSNDRNKTLSRK